MSDLPQVIDFGTPVITTNSRQCIGIELAGLNTMDSTFTGTWPTANLAIFIPMKLGYIFTAVKMFWANGSTVGTNTAQVGIYDSQGNQLTSSTAATTSGASVLQEVSITSITLESGLYYLAMVVNGTTDTFSRGLPGAPLTRAIGVLNMASAAPLPSTATMVGSTATNGYFPMLGVTSNSTAL